MISVGIDVGGTKVLAVALGEDGRVEAEARRATADGLESLLDELAALYAELAGSAGHEYLPLGVGLPGLVDPSGRLLFAPNLHHVGPNDLRSGLRARIGSDRTTVVQLDNDATCAAAGEAVFGAGRGRSDVLFVTLGTGIGGGIVAGGEVIRGARNFAGEIGHTVVDPQGPPCGCGRRGCWERYASGSGLGRIARDFALAGRAKRIVDLAGGEPDAVRGEHVMLALEEDDEQARAILEEFAWWLALGLANLANVLDPRTIVIGGGLSRGGDRLLDPVRRFFGAQLEGGGVRPAIEIRPAALGERGGAIGAALLAAASAGHRLDCAQ